MKNENGLAPVFDICGQDSNPVNGELSHGSVANVVFPTGIDQRDDIGKPDRFDVYYGMADSRIGVARLDLPDVVPAGGAADSPEAKV